MPATMLKNSYVHASWFQDLINVWTMPATMLKNSYVHAIHSQCRFCKLKMLYSLCIFTFRTRLVLTDTDQET